MSSKFTMKTPEQHQGFKYFSGVSVLEVEQEKADCRAGN